MVRSFMLTLRSPWPTIYPSNKQKKKKNWSITVIFIKCRHTSARVLHLKDYRCMKRLPTPTCNAYHLILMLPPPEPHYLKYAHLSPFIARSFFGKTTCSESQRFLRLRGHFQRKVVNPHHCEHIQ